MKERERMQQEQEKRESNAATRVSHAGNSDPLTHRTWCMHTGMPAHPGMAFKTCLFMLNGTGGERACNFAYACRDGEMLMVSY